MRRILPLAALVVMAGCSSGPKVPPPNSAQAIYDGRDRAVQVMISNIGPPASVALVSASGTRLEAPGITLLAGPHVVYTPPPTIGIGIGIGGFGFSGCCGFGSGVGVDVPVGQPRPSVVNDQYIASALIREPADYRVNWSTYHVEVSTGGPPMLLPAPSPG